MIPSAKSLPGKIYIVSGPFIALGLWLFLFLRLPLPNLGFSLGLQVVFFLLLTIGAGLSPVKLPRGGVMTVAFALDYAGLLIFGAPLAAGIAAVSAPFVLRGASPFKIFWNAGQIIFSVLGAGYAYSLTGGKFLFNQTDLSFNQVDFSRCLPALAIAGIVYVAVNTFAVAGAIAACTDRPLIGTWIVSFRWMAGRFLAVAPFGVLMAIVFQIRPEAMKFAALALFFIPLVLARWAFKGSMGMLEVYNQTIQALSNALEAYDPYTRNHSERVTRMAEQIARHMHLPEPKVDALMAAARLHDMGKCRYDWEMIIRKPGRPTEQEWQVIRCHPLDGANIAREMQVALLPSTAEIVSAHHERMDGSGYPKGLKGAEIDLAGRILCVADAYEAITSRRAYQKRRTTEEALNELRKSAGAQFDPSVVKAVEELIESGKAGPEFYIGNEVEQL